jgi:glycosyltransferase involved in cell wall biosynthesis
MIKTQLDKNNPLISIILPIYNTRDYLERCLNSICGQTYKNIEIIAVDDGSTDGSEKILDEFAKNDKRIRAVHKSNCGESNARNMGLRMMKGEYVGFIDCDDWIESNMYETLISIAIANDVDMVASTWFKDTNNTSDIVCNKYEVTNRVFEKEQLLNYIYKRDSYQGFAYMWNKLYRRDLFYDNEGKLILFDEDLELGGDVLYLGRLILNTKSAIYVDKAFYHYYQRENSGCHTENLKKRLDWIEAYIRLIKYIEENKIDTEALIWIKRFLAYHSTNVAKIAYRQGNNIVLKECQDIMGKYKNEYIKTNKEYEDRINTYLEVLNYSL